MFPTPVLLTPTPKAFRSDDDDLPPSLLPTPTPPRAFVSVCCVSSTVPLT